MRREDAREQEQKKKDGEEGIGKLEEEEYCSFQLTVDNNFFCGKEVGAKISIFFSSRREQKKTMNAAPKSYF